MVNVSEQYGKLNAAQKTAVTAIDGPVLVIAGPGTGKTHLLSARVAHILEQTDTLPQNILCLTFTESGAENMRERLSRFIGKSAYDVTIGTYHSFGSDLLRRYPEYFQEINLESPVDELGRRQILSNIVDALSYNNPLKQTRHHLGDLMSTISEVKRGLLSADDLRVIAAANLTEIQLVSKQIGETLQQYATRLPSKLAVAEPLFQHIHDTLATDNNRSTLPGQVHELTTLAAEELAAALMEAGTLNKSTPLTKWKNTWLAKDENNQYILDGRLAAQRMAVLADVLDSYQAALATRGLYDFDDMILQAIHVLKSNDELRFTLQERYQYLLLDEFQDTNAAQLQLVELLTNNPVNEGRPNVLAVGDDDQAIYAFQGAQYSNMIDFYNLYRDVTVINLTENYRATSELLAAAQNISQQIAERLKSAFTSDTKALVAARTDLPTTRLERRSFVSDVSQYAWIAQQIAKDIEQGTAAKDIAVLAPKHRYLEPLVPYLQLLGVPVRYEKRENILEAPVVRQLLIMSRLVLALQAQDHTTADALWPEVLSYDFWKLPTSTIWKLSWEAAKTKTPWSQLLLDDKACRVPALLFLALSSQVTVETLEAMLDKLIGTDSVETNEPDLPLVRSPLRDFYADTDATAPDVLYETVTQLAVLRARLQAHQQSATEFLTLQDLLAFVSEYEAADERMVNTSPYNEGTDAVQLMTVFKAKGLEFDEVFLVSCQDDVWGSSSRGQSNKLTLPANLSLIRHAGTTEDERLRLLFVAMTRAKHTLYLTSYNKDYTGKNTRRLSYFEEIEQPDGTITSSALPTGYQHVIEDGTEAPTLRHLETNWRQRHVSRHATLDKLLEEQLTHYQLSPTHLTSFIDVEYAGPQAFLLNTLLRFPSAPTPATAYGNSMHETMEWLQIQVTKNEALPPMGEIQSHFDEQIRAKKLNTQQTGLEIERGHASLISYLKQRGHIFKPGDRAEYNFRNEGVFIGSVHMSGKVDRMEVDTTTKTITVVDYKTGTPHARWAAHSGLHRYELQLYCYKLLIEHSHSFAGYKVTSGRVEFTEPDEQGRIHHLDLTFDPATITRVTALLTAMWEHVTTLNIPATGSYPTTLAGIKQFEQDLLDKTI